MRPRRKAAREAERNITGVLKGGDNIQEEQYGSRSRKVDGQLRRSARTRRTNQEAAASSSSESSSEHSSVVSSRARWRLPATSRSSSSDEASEPTESEVSTPEEDSEEAATWSPGQRRKRVKESASISTEPRQSLIYTSGLRKLENISMHELDERSLEGLEPSAMWQLPATWRLLQVFSKRLGIPDVTPMELEHALETPQYAPILAEIMASLAGYRTGSGTRTEHDGSRAVAALQRADWVQRADALWFPQFVRFFQQHLAEMINLGLYPEERSTSTESADAASIMDALEAGGWEAFLQLRASQRLLILYALCEFVLCSPNEDNRYLKDLRQLHHDDLRILPVGIDRNGALYWYFDDNCRLYRELLDDTETSALKSTKGRRRGAKPSPHYEWCVAAQGPDALRDLIETLDDARPRSRERALRQWLKQELLPVWEEHSRKLERLQRRRERLERLLATKRTSSRVQELELARQREEELRKQREEEAKELERQRRREELERRRELERIERLAKRQRAEIERALRAAERERAEAEAQLQRRERTSSRLQERENGVAEEQTMAATKSSSSVNDDAMVLEEHIPPEMNLPATDASSSHHNAADATNTESALPQRLLTWFRILDECTGEHACLDALELEQTSAKRNTGGGPGALETPNSLVAEGLLIPGAGPGSVKLRPTMIRTSRILEWCIDYGEVCIWIRTARAWYKLVTPHPSHEPYFATTRRKFELSIRVSILCASFPNSKACSFRNLSKLLVLPYGEMRGYAPEEVIAEARFLLNQAEMLGRPEMRDNAFMRRLRRETEAAALRERARQLRSQQRAAQKRHRVASWAPALPFVSEGPHSQQQPRILIRFDTRATGDGETRVRTPQDSEARNRVDGSVAIRPERPSWSVAASYGPGLFFSKTPKDLYASQTAACAPGKRPSRRRHWWVAASYGPGIWWLRVRRPRRRPVDQAASVAEVTAAPPAFAAEHVERYPRESAIRATANLVTETPAAGDCVGVGDGVAAPNFTNAPAATFGWNIAGYEYEPDQRSVASTHCATSAVRQLHPSAAEQDTTSPAHSDRENAPTLRETSSPVASPSLFSSERRSMH